MYIPNFTPSNEPCVLPTCTETRSRNTTSFGLFFRSKIPGNTTILKVACRLFGATIDPLDSDIRIETYKVKYFENNAWSVEEPFIQKKNTVSNTITASCINDVKAFINNSTQIESPIKNFDVQDAGTEPQEIDEFETQLVGATSGPIDDSAISSIRTGPKYTMVCITSTEDANGNNITPSQKNRFWNGTMWDILE